LLADVVNTEVEDEKRKQHKEEEEEENDMIDTLQHGEKPEKGRSSMIS